AEDGIRDDLVTGVQTCALPICCLGRDPRNSAVAIFSLHERFGGTREGRGENRYLIALWHGLAWIAAVQCFNQNQRCRNIGSPAQIGRASCRERGDGSVGAEGVR